MLGLVESKGAVTEFWSFDIESRGGRSRSCRHKLTGKQNYSWCAFVL